MDLELIIKILFWSIPLIAGAFLAGYKWVRNVEKSIENNRVEAEKIMEKHRTDNTLLFQEHDLRLKAAEKLIEYLVGAGAELKEQQAKMSISINSIQDSILHINESMKTIIGKLDKYDTSITQFYRDFDLKHKEAHK